MVEIEVVGLTKTYRIAEKGRGVLGLFRRSMREIHALQDVSFSVQRGELIGFIGPNGAGKSTAIKILSGILRPSAGTVSVGGLIPWEHRIEHVARLGAVFGQRSQLWWDLPVIDGFNLLRDIYRVNEQEYRATRDELVAMLKLESLLEQPVRQLSLGQRMRAEIAAALLHSPRLLFLDEPTIGLDAPSKLAVREFVKTLNRERGVTVLVTTHDMHDIEALAERVVIIGHGRILADQPFARLRTEVLSQRRLVVEFTGPPPEITVEGTTVARGETNCLEFAFDPEIIGVADLIGQIAAASIIKDLHVELPSIEEVIANFYQRHGALEA